MTNVKAGESIGLSRVVLAKLVASFLGWVGFGLLRSIRAHWGKWLFGVLVCLGFWVMVGALRLNAAQNEACRQTCGKKGRLVHGIDFERAVCVCGARFESVVAEGWPK